MLPDAICHHWSFVKIRLLWLWSPNCLLQYKKVSNCWKGLVWVLRWPSLWVNWKQTAHWRTSRNQSCSWPSWREVWQCEKNLLWTFCRNWQNLRMTGLLSWLSELATTILWQLWWGPSWQSLEKWQLWGIQLTSSWTHTSPVLRRDCGVRGDLGLCGQPLGVPLVFL